MIPAEVDAGLPEAVILSSQMKIHFQLGSAPETLEGWGTHRHQQVLVRFWISASFGMGPHLVAKGWMIFHSFERPFEMP